MSVFTAAEAEYLQRMTMCRLATVGANGQPHVIPVTFHYNPAEDAIDIGGVDFAAGKKWRDLQRNHRVTVLVDDANPQGARAVEIRGEAELHESGDDEVNPRFPNFVPQFVRIRPRFIVSWGLEEPGFHPFGRAVERAAGGAGQTSESPR
jgi:PPOX class F420-dependent enzyme/OxyR family protein